MNVRGRRFYWDEASDALLILALAEGKNHSEIAALIGCARNQVQYRSKALTEAGQIIPPIALIRSTTDGCIHPLWHNAAFWKRVRHLVWKEERVMEHERARKGSGNRRANDKRDINDLSKLGVAIGGQNDL